MTDRSGDQDATGTAARGTRSPGTATLLGSPGATHLPALLRAERGRLVLDDGSSRRRIFEVGADVESLGLRRITPDGADATVRVWALDLMRDGQAVARLTAPPFAFDRERGPAALAERAGLPLVQRLPRLETDPRIVEPGRSPAWLLALVAMSYAAVLWLTAHVVLDRRPQELLLAATALVAAGALVGWRVRSRRARGRVLFRARPNTPVPRRFAAGATVTTVAGALSVTNGSRSRWLVPLPGDDLGPVALRPGRLGDQRQGAVKRLALVAPDGHVLLHLGRSEWCGDGSEAQLAAAIGVPWDPTPVKGLDMTSDRGVTPDGADVLDPQPLLVPGLVAWWATLWSLSGDDGPLRWLTTVAGVVAICAGPVVFFGLLVRAPWGRREVRPRQGQVTP